MKNPWNELTSKDGITDYILKSELPVINKFNELQRIISKDEYYNYHIHTRILPAPFMGDVMNSPIVLLTLNPGWDEEEAKKDFYNKYSAYWITMLTHEFPIPDLPLFCLDEEYAESSPYWVNKLIPLIEETSKEAVARNISVIQFFPYQSKKYKGMNKKLSNGFLESQKYNFDLVKKAIDRKALIIILRGRRIWKDAVEELKEYPRLKYTNSVLNPILSENNLGSDVFHEIMEKIK